MNNSPFGAPFCSQSVNLVLGLSKCVLALALTLELVSASLRGPIGPVPSGALGLFFFFVALLHGLPPQPCNTNQHQRGKKQSASTVDDVKITRNLGYCLQFFAICLHFLHDFGSSRVIFFFFISDLLVTSCPWSEGLPVFPLRALAASTTLCGAPAP